MTNEEITFDLVEAFRNKERSISGDLAGATEAGHPGTIGDITESTWALRLREGLPSRYCVATNRVIIDSDGLRTEQIDIVIFDPQFAPSLVVLGWTEVIPIESVYAVFEVKQELNKENIQKAGAKAKSVRRLSRHPGEMGTINGSFAMKQENLKDIVGGILCSRSAWREPLGSKLEEHLDSLDDQSRLDIGCVAGVGAFDMDLDSNTLRRSIKDVAAGAFTLALFKRLQLIGNAPAIDPTRYSQGIWKD